MVNSQQEHASVSKKSTLKTNSAPGANPKDHAGNNNAASAKAASFIEDMEVAAHEDFMTELQQKLRAQAAQKVRAARLRAAQSAKPQ